MFSTLEDESPMSKNSQRKIDVDSDSVYHMVYESSNDIWYAQSTNSGTNWSPEELVSNGFGYSHRPCIAEHDGRVYIVYVTGDGEIELKTRIGFNQWVYVDLSWSGTTQIPNETYPVVEVNNACTQPFPDLIAIAWEDRVGGVGKIRYHVTESEAIGLTTRKKTGDLYTSNSSQPRYPSIATTPNWIGFDVAWNDTGKVQYSSFWVFRCNPAVDSLYPLFRPVELVSDDFEYVIGAPSLAIDFMQKPSVAYESVFKTKITPPGDGRPIGSTLIYMNHLSLRGTPRIRVRQRAFVSIDPWRTTSNTYLWGTKDYELARPSIGAQPLTGCTNTNQGLRVGFNYDPKDDYIIKVLQIVDPNSCIIGVVSQTNHFGYDPNLVGRSELSKRLRELFCEFETSPGEETQGASVLIGSTNEHLGKIQTAPTSIIRETGVTKDTAFALFAMHEPRIINGGSELVLDWDAVHDSLVVNVNTTLHDKMKTQSFVVQSGDTLVFDKQTFVKAPNDFQGGDAFRVTVYTATNILHQESYPIQSFASDSADASTEYLQLTNFADSTVFIAVSLSPGIDTFEVSVNQAMMEDDGQQKRANRSIANRPENIWLSPAFPNPFSDMTVFRFGNSEGSRLKLTVFDISGQEIATLVNRWMNAGTHEIVFNSGHLPSGLYFYRLEANTRSITRRMHLVR